jgi:hypothetical protein
LGDYILESTEDDGVGVMTLMQTWLIQQQDFNGNVQLSSQTGHSFYQYSVWQAGEHLFDGVAGDLPEAVDSLVAHINFLSASRNGVVAVA